MSPGTTLQPVGDRGANGEKVNPKTFSVETAPPPLDTTGANIKLNLNIIQQMFVECLVCARKPKPCKVLDQKHKLYQQQNSE